jgi:hypothetical protein
MSSAKNATLLMATIASQAVLAQGGENHLAGSSEVIVQHTSDTGFLLILKSSRSTTVPARQEELVPKAAELCAPQRVSFGKYTFDMKERVTGRKDKAIVLIAAGN